MSTKPTFDMARILPPLDLDQLSPEVRRLADGIDPSVRRVLGTRRIAQQVAERLPPKPAVLDFTDVEVVSTPFLHELRRLRRADEITGLNDFNAECLALVLEHEQRYGA